MVTRLAVIFSLVILGCQKKEAPTPPATEAPSTEEKRAAKPAESTTQSPVETAKPITPAQASLLNEAAPKFEAYRNQSQALLSAIKGGSSADAIGDQGKTLTKTGQSIIPAVLVRFPECQSYLNAVSAAAVPMFTMAIEKIETDYHKDGALPKNSRGECYHAKDLVVHAATVVAISANGLAAAEDKQAAQSEINEVLTHLDQLKTAIVAK